MLQNLNPTKRPQDYCYNFYLTWDFNGMCDLEEDVIVPL